MGSSYSLPVFANLHHPIRDAMDTARGKEQHRQFERIAADLELSAHRWEDEIAPDASKETIETARKISARYQRIVKDAYECLKHTEKNALQDCWERKQIVPRYEECDEIAEAEDLKIVVADIKSDVTLVLDELHRWKAHTDLSEGKEKAAAMKASDCLVQLAKEMAKCSTAKTAQAADECFDVDKFQKEADRCCNMGLKFQKRPGSSTDDRL